MCSFVPSIHKKWTLFDVRVHTVYFKYISTHDFGSYPLKKRKICCRPQYSVYKNPYVMLTIPNITHRKIRSSLIVMSSPIIAVGDTNDTVTPIESYERCLMCIIIMIIATGRSSCLNKWRYVLFNLKIREAHCAYVERIMMDFRGTNDMAWGGVVWNQSFRLSV